MDNERKIPGTDVYPVIALRGLNVFPGMIIHFDLSRKKSIAAVNAAMKKEQEIFLTAQKKMDDEEPKFADLYQRGIVAVIKQVTKLPNHTVRVLVEGQLRAGLLSLIEDNTAFLMGNVEAFCEAKPVEDMEETAMLRMIMELTTDYVSHFPKIAQTLESQITEDMDLPQILDRIAMNLPIPYDKKQEILEAWDVQTRYDTLAKILTEETQIAHIREDLAEEIKGRIEKNQRDYILHEQLMYIKKELSQEDGYSDKELYEARLQQLHASGDVKEKIAKEIRHFDSIADSSAESGVERGYIETLLELPWDTVSEDNLDLNRAENILNANHYGMDKVKERMLEFLAVRTLTRNAPSPIVCLVGPPGTGKTSIAKSVAEALNKKYLRICLGGVRDEAEIRGHRRTYVGAMPGRIAGGLRQAGVKNPLMLLDEIDKISSDYKGDTFSALLEVLDPDQNKHFRDHYVEIPLDLSEVLFLATANSIANIPRPLLDRMEVIEVSGYTENEKFHIAREHLLQKQYDACGMTKKVLNITDRAVKDIIHYYTREAGVRALERKIGEVCRKSARELLQEKTEKITVTGNNLGRYLGKRKYLSSMANKRDEVGIVRGLAWTVAGGETLQIEVNKMPGKGEVEFTGQMGDVMKESAHIGFSYIRSVAVTYGVKQDIFKKNDFHLHIPEGAVPKDGPSAGITMATALLSAITGQKVRADVAMTGEITLRGRVLPVGGLKEKILAAKMAGIQTVLVPVENEKDIEEIAGEITDGLEILYVSQMKEVIDRAFVKGKDRA